MTRADLLGLLTTTFFDVLVIGGGATGLGIAVDAASRGYRTALVEAGDFAQATSSRATKLVHGGVRYLASGQMHLVYEALRERAVMQRNAPHLVRAQSFLLPTYKWRDLPVYASGLLLYDLLSGAASMGPTRVLDRHAALERIPNLASAGLAGAILYHDGQFNDARLALALARTALDHGAAALNYVRCERLLETNGRCAGALVVDRETGEEHEVLARVVINAAGIFVDQVRQLDEPGAKPMLTVSRGTHIVVPSDVLNSRTALMIPKTRDGRVIFAIPWEGRVVIGTTDVAASFAEIEPGYSQDEIDFLLGTINPYLARAIERCDVLSIFSGLRPLVRAEATSTSKLSREHTITVSSKGLMTVAGGKWTTYRRMAEGTLDTAIRNGAIERRACVSADLRLHAAPDGDFSESDPYLCEYGSEASILRTWMNQDDSMTRRIDHALPYTVAEVLFAVRYEMARTVEDVLSRRTRALLLDAKAAARAAAAVATVMAAELGYNAAWEAAQVKQFNELASRFYTLEF